MAQPTYTMNYSNFVGVDVSSDPRVVARNRLARSVNMWRDYESAQGAAIETFPGFRKILGTDNNAIVGMWSFKSSLKEDYLIVHVAEKLYYIKLTEYNPVTNKLEKIENPSKKEITDMTLSTSDVAFNINNSLFIISNKRYYKVFESESDIESEVISVEGSVRGEVWIPTTYYNGKPYEQRNALSSVVYQVNTDGGVENADNSLYVNIPIYERVNYDSSEKADPRYEQILSVEVSDVEFEQTNEEFPETGQYTIRSRTTTTSGTEKGYSEVTLQFLKTDIYNADSKFYNKVKIKYNAFASHFNTIGNLVHFQNNNLTMAEAILGCTKSAVYDGRVFLTGNPELPNTVFYSQRNLTGANDPTYFGVYNYFNDGDGNTPNVDLLATPSMLMVIKSDTVQDGSVYYHVGADNPHSDETVRNLVPRIYPSTQGASGLGSAGDTQAYSLSCNFFDDPVFLSKRGLEGVSKEQLNSERTIGHRSSNIDRLLIKEDLAHASLAEWKGYLVICCNGHIYLADSRSLFRHQTGSYQYEWFYLEGVGTYEKYETVYRYKTNYPYITVPNVIDADTYEVISWEDVSLSKFTLNGDPLDQKIKLYNSEEKIYDTDLIQSATATYISITNSLIDVMYVTVDGKKYLVDSTEEKKGSGAFYGAKHVLAIDDMLIFATDFDICVFNTDKRGVSIKNEKNEIIRQVDDDKIDYSWYSFNGVPYVSGCSIRLDDCDKKALTKTTVYGTTVARLKMIPGSHCRITSSVNGRDWVEIGEAFNTRLDFSDIRFDNFSFTENEDNVAVLPELSRRWISKQYYFYSNGFCEPFGLYELSYIYQIAGKIRY